MIDLGVHGSGDCGCLQWGNLSRANSAGKSFEREEDLLREWAGLKGLGGV